MFDRLELSPPRIDIESSRVLYYRRNHGFVTPAYEYWDDTSADLEFSTAPKKKEQQQKMSLGDFLTDSGMWFAIPLNHRHNHVKTTLELKLTNLIGFGGGSWADEVEETYGMYYMRDSTTMLNPC